MQRRISISIAVVSFAVVAFQLTLMQVLSIVQWHHFAYMIISVALLGFGAAGTFLSVFRKWSLRHSAILLPFLMMMSGLTMALSVRFSQSDAIRFDTYLLFSDFRHSGKLLATYILLFIPFFLGALSVGMVFVKMTREIGRIYFSNLLGSGIGGLAALAVLELLSPEKGAAALGLLPVIAGTIIIPRKHGYAGAALSFISILITIVNFQLPLSLRLSEYKSLSKTMELPEAQILLTENSAYGKVQTVNSPALRFAPGLSLAYSGEAPVNQALFVNGDWFGPLVRWKGHDSSFIMNYSTAALPYALGKRVKILSLNAGAGLEAAHALALNAAEITAVEPNSVVLKLLRTELAEATDSLFLHPRIRVHALTSRSFLEWSTGKYDLVTLPLTGAFGGASGLNAMQEQYHLTREAFAEMWKRLTDDGVIAVSCWMDYPYRIPLRIMATISEMLEAESVQNPAAHVMAVRSWSVITFVIKRTPLEREEIERARNFCNALFFDPVLMPGVSHEEKSRFNVLQDDRFFDYIDQILSGNRASFYQNYAFNVRPATDNRPYFSQFIRWRTLPDLAEHYGVRSMPFLEAGYLIAAVTFIQILVVALTLIIIPLFRIGWKGGEKLWTLFYFGGLGLGYMLLEIMLIQRFSLYFGNPIYATGAVICFMLICSGAGSYYSSGLTTSSRTFCIILATIIGLLALYTIFLTPALKTTISWRLPFKILSAGFMIALPAFFMGFPFPLGLRLLSKRNEEAVPWAWGINGCLSVISAALAAIVAVELGFSWVMTMAVVAYVLPFMAIAAIKFK